MTTQGSEKKMLNITAGLRKVIYDINPSHLYCPYKAAFERWALEVLSDDLDSIQIKTDVQSSGVKKPATALAARPKPVVSHSSQHCSNSSKSDMEGWCRCTSYHNYVSHKIYQSSVLPPKKTDKLPKIPNYNSYAVRNISARAKNSLRRGIQNYSKIPATVAKATVSSCQNGEESDSGSKRVVTKKTLCPLTSYSFNITDSPEENIQRYRRECTYSRINPKLVASCSSDKMQKLALPVRNASGSCEIPKTTTKPSYYCSHKPRFVRQQKIIATNHAADLGCCMTSIHYPSYKPSQIPQVFLGKQKSQPATLPIIGDNQNSVKTIGETAGPNNISKVCKY